MVVVKRNMMPDYIHLLLSVLPTYRNIASEQMDHW